jgi:hypothetical protein
MNCTACFSVMTNRDERHHVDPDSYRMNLHCHNYDNCPAGGSHFGVIVPPSYSNQEWICDHYNLRFIYKDRFFILRAIPSTPTLYQDNDGKFHLHYYKPYKFTQLLSSFYDPYIVQVPFIPLSTNNDMHEHATEVFHKLRKLIVFS